MLEPGSSPARRFLLLLVLCLAPVVAGCGDEAAANPKVCSPQSSRVPCTSAQIGTDYPVALSTHCGVGGYVYFDGRYWVIDPIQPSPSNSLQGEMSLVSRDLAQFRGDRLRFAFKPAPPSFTPPDCY